MIVVASPILSKIILKQRIYQNRVILSACRYIVVKFSYWKVQQAPFQFCCIPQLEVVFALWALWILSSGLLKCLPLPLSIGQKILVSGYVRHIFLAGEIPYFNRILSKTLYRIVFPLFSYRSMPGTKYSFKMG